MATAEIKNNWITGHCGSVLNQIQQDPISIAVYDRNTEHLSSSINALMDKTIEFSVSGDIETILKTLKYELAYMKVSIEYSDILLKDVEALLLNFKNVSEVDNFRLLLATIDGVMCSRFHTDCNDLRMLCTYSGPGTLWLTEENINRKALNSCGSNECIVVNQDKIKQVKTGSVIVLKGSTYSPSQSKAAVHRSPDVEREGEKRLLLRIDTNKA